MGTFFLFIFFMLPNLGHGAYTNSHTARYLFCIASLCEAKKEQFKCSTCIKACGVWASVRSSLALCLSGGGSSSWAKCGLRAH